MNLVSSFLERDVVSVQSLLVILSEPNYRPIRYGDSAGNTAEENCSVFSLVRMH